MNRPIRTIRGFYPLLLFASLFILTACELPAQRTDPIQLDTNTQVQIPVVDPNLQPGFDPAAQPGGQEGYPAPGIDQTPVITPTTGDQTTAPEGGVELEPAVPAEAAPGGVYVVQPGDTLGQIAQRFSVSIQDIAAANGLVNIHALDVGQELTIPAAGFAEQQSGGDASVERIHIVQQGENLYRIGLLYGFTIEELRAYNNLVNPNSLDVGQELRIPAAP